MVVRGLLWIVRRLGASTLWSFTLLLVAVGSVAIGLAELIRGAEGRLLLATATAGLLVGWLLARGALPNWAAALVAAATGVGAVFLRVGYLDRLAFGSATALASYAWAVLHWLHGGPFPDPVPVVTTLTKLGSAVYVLLLRLRDWSLGLLAGEAAFDPVAAALVWSLVLWGLAAWAAWAVRRRRQPLWALLPAGALLAASLAYAGGNAYLLLPLLGSALLLIPWVGHEAHESRWTTEGIDFSPEIRADVILVTFPVCLVLVATAALVPAFSVQRVVRFAHRLMGEPANQGNPVAGSLGLVPPPAEARALEDLRTPGLPRRHLIGAGPELSQRVVMTVRVEGVEATPDQAPRFYWRGITYDVYTGYGWLTGPTAAVRYRAGIPAGFDEFSPSSLITSPGRWMVRQEVQAVGDLGGLLFAAGDLITADRDYLVVWRSAEDAFATLIEATAYRADSLIPVPTEDQLRAVGTGYPGWVQERFLALPEGVPRRVRELALRLTATAPTPYDRARAIESFLRTYPYTLDLPAPPLDRDVADYFLFELRKGYCDYYATAMVVLARAAGLPARLAVGYASGTYDALNRRYIVTEADAHSWPEVYFPGYGWVPFEPTAGQPPLERESPEVVAETPKPPPLPPLRPTPSFKPSRWWRWASPGAAALLVLGTVAWWLIDRWRLRHLAPAAALTLIYRRLQRHMRRLGVPMRDGDTPYELATALADRLREFPADGRWGAIITPAAAEAHRLVEGYVSLCYGSRSPDVAEQRQTIRTWHRLRRRLWLAWVWQLKRRFLA